MNTQEKLFNPNLVYAGNVSYILYDYPIRSENLEQLTTNNETAKNLLKMDICTYYVGL